MINRFVSYLHISDIIIVGIGATQSAISDVYCE